ncbi:MAG: hypothetical protein ACI85O_003721, partial [Saprospiraceae bacterium]
MNARFVIWFFFIIVFLASSCTEETVIYDVSPITVTPNNGGKTKEKSTEQFLNIAYANLYQTALSPSELVELTNIINSIGDKQVAYETVIAKMMSDSDIILPSTDSMRSDLVSFITETYKRFYVRNPTEAEKTWWIN